MIEMLLLCAILLTITFLIITNTFRRHRDATFVAILLMAIVLRLIVGYANLRFGPFPGAEIDAVNYERRAAAIAQDTRLTGHFDFEIGRYGYSSLLALFYLMAGRSPLIATALNALLILSLITVVYRICISTWNRRVALTVSLTLAFFPANVLYTAVPLREAPLMWGTGLWLAGIFDYLQGRSKLPLNTRTFLGPLVALWLHTAFFLLFILIPIAAWAKGVLAAERRAPMVKSFKTVLAGVGLIFVFLIFVRLAGSLEKIPDDPSQLTSLDYLNNLRSYKASYGTGYLGFAPNSLGLLIATMPLLVFRFLFSPTALDLLGKLSLSEGLKMMDGFVFMVGTILALKGSRSAWRRGAKLEVLIISLTLLSLICTFAIGTANIGIAIRHRAKFAWMFALLAGLGWSTPKSHVGRRERTPISAEERLLG